MSDRRSIVVIEDQTSVLENIVEILEEEGFDAYGAMDGFEGIDLVKRVHPDLIMCDIIMPEMSGFEVLRELQKKHETATIPFIFLTAKAGIDEIRRGMELGADDYLIKPFTPGQLVKAVDIRLKKFQRHNQLSEKKLEELKINLASTLPHELRTPLNGIVTSAQFIVDYIDNLEKDEIKQINQSIHQSSQRLKKLILNYLFFVEIQMIYKENDNKQNLKQFTTDSPEVIIKTALNHISTEYVDNNFKFSEIEDSPIVMMEEHFFKITEELLDNAFKFAKPATDIFIDCSVNKHFYNLKVTNFGRGMTGEQIKNISAYVQFDRKKYEQQGAGLGLAIVKSLVEIYDGKFNIESVPGEFTEIEVNIPLAE